MNCFSGNFYVLNESHADVTFSSVVAVVWLTIGNTEKYVVAEVEAVVVVVLPIVLADVLKSIRSQNSWLIKHVTGKMSTIYEQFISNSYFIRGTNWISHL
jgi:hypothetical protein